MGSEMCIRDRDLRYSFQIESLEPHKASVRTDGIDVRYDIYLSRVFQYLINVHSLFQS